MLKRLALGFIASALFIVSCAAGFGIFQTSINPVAFGWFDQPIGAGGNVDGISITGPVSAGGPSSPVLVVRTDVYGGYVWKPTTPDPVNGQLGTWQQVVLASSYPPTLATQAQGYSTGLYELVVAPNNGNQLYMMTLVPGTPYAYNMGVFYSTDQGNTWTKSNGIPTTISSGTYNNGTGVVSLTLSSAVNYGSAFNGLSPTIHISGLTGTGAFASLDGDWLGITAATAGGGGVTTTTVTYQGPVGAGASTITGGVLTADWSANTGNGGFVDGNKGSGQKMAVEQGNSSNVYMGTPQSGLFRSTDAGHTWTLCTALLPVAIGGNFYGYTGIVIDPTNANNVTVGINGRGVYRTTGGCLGTWTLLSGGPSTAMAAGTVALTGGQIDASSNVYYATDSANNGWVYASGAWTHPFTAGTVQTIMTDPQTTGHAIATNNGTLNETTNGGTSWSGFATASIPIASPNDVTWLSNVFGGIGGTNGSVIDPTVGTATTRKIYAVANESTWQQTLPGAITSGNTSYTWNSMGRGNEEIVGNRIIVPDASGSFPIGAGWDFNTFYFNNNAAYPTHNGRNTGGIMAAWSIDYVTQANGGTTPATVAYFGDGNYFGAGEGHSWSTDGGNIWTVFNGPAAYTNTNGGNIAVSTPTNWILSAGTGQPYYTTNAGIVSPTWNAIDLTSSGIINPYVVSSGTYNSSTGAVVLTLSTTPSFTAGAKLSVSNLTATGGGSSNIGNLDGTFTSTNVSGNTVTYTASTGQGAITITGGNITGWPTWVGDPQGQTWVCADKVNANQFTLEIAGIGFTTTINSGAAWTLSTSGVNATAGAGQLKCVDGNANHVFWASGGLGAGGVFQGSPFYYTTNSRANPIVWNTVTNMVGAGIVGYGMHAPGQTYPAVYTVGAVLATSTSSVSSTALGNQNFVLSGVTGSTFLPGQTVGLVGGGATLVGQTVSWTPGTSTLVVNVLQNTNGVSGTFSSWNVFILGEYVATTGMPTTTPAWTAISAYPGGSQDTINDITGDPNNYGIVYISKAGSGYARNKFNFLLKRDINPASNDNSPMGLEKAV